MILALSAAALIALCPAPGSSGGSRHHCVVDGDTVWWNGEKIRIADIDAPELHGRCQAERARAGMARDRLLQLLAGRRVTITRTGKDRFGRTLARLSVDGRSIGDQLKREGHAVPWPNRKDWCR